MMRTIAPNDLVGRLLRNCALTTPELPAKLSVSLCSLSLCLPSSFSFRREYRTVRPSDLAPDDTNLGASDLLLAAVDVCDALAQVERCGLGVLDTLDLDERGVGVGVTLAALVGKVLAPAKMPC